MPLVVADPEVLEDLRNLEDIRGGYYPLLYCLVDTSSSFPTVGDLVDHRSRGILQQFRRTMYVGKLKYYDSARRACRRRIASPIRERDG